MIVKLNKSLKIFWNVDLTWNDNKYETVNNGTFIYIYLNSYKIKVHLCVVDKQ